MSSREIFDPKLLGATKVYTFDFTSDLSTGETISTQSVTATTYSRTDAAPTSIISGSASTSGAIVSQTLIRGVLGVLYDLLCQVTISLGQTLQKNSFLALWADLC